MPALHIELLPDLTMDQKSFALGYYPVFDRLKRALLMISGSMLLAMQKTIPNNKYQTVLKSALQEIKNAKDEWLSWKPKKDFANEYALILSNISELGELAYSLYQQSEGCKEIMLTDSVDRLSNMNLELRRMALRYWRLELVAETHGH